MNKQTIQDNPLDQPVRAHSRMCRGKEKINKQKINKIKDKNLHHPIILVFSHVYAVVLYFLFVVPAVDIEG